VQESNGGSHINSQIDGTDVKGDIEVGRGDIRMGLYRENSQSQDF
jgi:hypothetical protein